MTNAVSSSFAAPAAHSTTNQRAQALAHRLEQGVRALIAFAEGLTDAQWKVALSPGGRTVGVVVHHVASVFPIEIQLAQTLANGKPVTGVTWEDVHNMNAQHLRENAGVTKEVAIDLLRRNSATAAAAIRGLSDEDLDRAAEASLYADAPVTCQFMLEDHAVRHSYHHLAGIRRALKL